MARKKSMQMSALALAPLIFAPLIYALLWPASGSFAADTNAAAKSDTGVVFKPPAEGSVTQAQGLEAWDRIYQVASHPRCANCHTGASDRPMWSGPSYGKTRPHGMNIRAGALGLGTRTGSRARTVFAAGAYR